MENGPYRQHYAIFRNADGFSIFEMTDCRLNVEKKKSFFYWVCPSLTSSTNCDSGETDVTNRANVLPHLAVAISSQFGAKWISRMVESVSPIKWAGIKLFHYVEKMDAFALFREFSSFEFLSRKICSKNWTEILNCCPSWFDAAALSTFLVTSEGRNDIKPFTHDVPLIK